MNANAPVAISTSNTQINPQYDGENIHKMLMPIGPIFFIVSHSDVGGVQELWANLVESLQDRGYPAHLVALYPGPHLERKAAPEASWRYIVPKRPTRVTAQLRLLHALVRVFRMEQPSLVVTAMPAANVLSPLAATLAGRGTRVVISHHSPTDTHNPLLNAADGWIGSLDTVRTVVSVSHAVAASLDGKPSSYRAKRRTIHNALPPKIEKLLAELAAHKAARRGKGRKVVAVGRLAPQKNYPMLVRAAAHMADVEVDVVGGGPDEAMLKELARSLGVQERVRFLGPFARQEALDKLADGDVFAQVSLFEGHSLALIEAAKLGMPLVVSDAPVQIEGITAKDGTRCGIVVGADDDAGLAREILCLLNDPSHHALWAERARKLAADATYDAMIAAYQELVGSGLSNRGKPGLAR